MCRQKNYFLYVFVLKGIQLQMKSSASGAVRLLDGGRCWVLSLYPPSRP